MHAIKLNSILGILKSGIAYLFIIGLYKYAEDKKLIQLYIDYELFLAASILITLGLQSKSYKKMREGGLVVISVVYFPFVLISAILVLVYSSNEMLLIFLVLSDRLLDTQLQIRRQAYKFLSYNIIDISNSVLVKMAFLMAAFNYNIWVLIILIKFLINVALLINGGIMNYAKLFKSEVIEIWKNRIMVYEWVTFDAVTYMTANLDLVLVRLFGPEVLIQPYYYVRKFLRMPLIILNYVLDPLYVKIRNTINLDDQLQMLRKTFGISLFIFGIYTLIASVLINYYEKQQYLYNVIIVLAVSFNYFLLYKFTDQFALIYLPQKSRLYFKGLFSAPWFILVFLPNEINLWLIALFAIPTLAWLFVLSFLLGRLPRLNIALALLLNIMGVYIVTWKTDSLSIDLLASGQYLAIAIVCIFCFAFGRLEFELLWRAFLSRCVSLRLEYRAPRNTTP